MEKQFEISNNPLFDIESLDENNSSSSFALTIPPLLLPLYEETENLELLFPFHISRKEEKNVMLISKTKFNTKKVKEKIKKEIKNKTRRYKEDDVRKKVKSNFLKALFTKINELLKSEGALFTFESFPQNFIADITQKTNFEVMELTYEDLFEYSHEKVVEENKYEMKPYQEQANKVAEKKYEKNLKTLEYLRNNKEISEKSGWERIKKMKYIDLLKAFFSSKEFENTVNELKAKEDKNYINNYIYFALNYIEYFQSYKPSTKKRAKKRKLKSELNQNSGNELNNTQSMESMALPPLIPLSFPLEEEEDILSNDNLPLSYSSGNYDITNQDSLFSAEMFGDFNRMKDK